MPRPAESHRARVPQGRRGLPPDRVGVARLHPRAVPGQLPPRPHPSLPALRRRSARSSPSSTRSSRRSCGTTWTRCAIDATGEYPPEVLDGLRRLGAFGMKIPKKYGGLGFTNVEYAEGHAAPRQRGRQRLRAALRPPVDRRAPAAQALRHRGAEEEVPAALRGGRDLGLRPHRAERRLRPGPGQHHRREDARRRRLPPERHQALVHERHARQAARGDGGPSRHQEDQRLRGRDGLAGREGRAPLPLHGPARPRQRRHQLHERARAGREPDRRRGHAASRSPSPP